MCLSRQTSHQWFHKYISKEVCNQSHASLSACSGGVEETLVSILRTVLGVGCWRVTLRTDTSLTG